MPAIAPVARVTRSLSSPTCNTRRETTAAYRQLQLDVERGDTVSDRYDLAELD